jgi:dihydrofolate reductase
MRKLIMWNIITLDGYFEGNQKGDLTFHNVVWGQELEKLSFEQLHSADYLVFGRVTYEGMAAYWNNTTLISENATDEIKKLKVQGG